VPPSLCGFKHIKYEPGRSRTKKKKGATEVEKLYYMRFERNIWMSEEKN